MRRYAGLLVVALSVAGAEVRTLTLRETVELALKQSPDLALARLDERKAEEAVRVARDPYVPKIAVGSGLAYSSGYPMSIEGASPSIFEARATQFVFNRPQHYRVSQAKEEARGAGLETQLRRDEVAFRAASLFLDAERGDRLAGLLREQLGSLERVEETVRLRVAEGRELPIESKRAALNLARARQRIESVELERDRAESLLATLLGMGAGDRVRPAVQDREPLAAPAPEEVAVEEALRGSKELRRLESALAAKDLEIRGRRAARLPQVDLVAQYGLFARFNNYEDYFRKFTRNNGQLGVSFQIPLFTGPGVDALAAQSEADAARLRVEARAARNRIEQETRRGYQVWKQARSAADVARLDLEVAREQLSVALAQMEEGRTSLRQVEEARLAENEKWLAFHDAQYAVEKARLDLLRQTGEILSLLR